MSTAAPSSLQSLTDSYSSLSTKLNSTITTLQSLEAQRTENASVSAEFSLLASSSNSPPKIYKLIGPVLVKQTLEEAKSTVEGRMGFIEKQIQEVEKQISEIKGRQENVKDEVRYLSYRRL
jgi:prefoldin beta subunit